jgi:hypothetical protein
MLSRLSGRACARDYNSDDGRSAVHENRARIIDGSVEKTFYRLISSASVSRRKRPDVNTTVGAYEGLRECVADAEGTCWVLRWQMPPNPLTVDWLKGRKATIRSIQ